MSEREFVGDACRFCGRRRPEPHRQLCPTKNFYPVETESYSPSISPSLPHHDAESPSSIGSSMESWRNQGTQLCTTNSIGPSHLQYRNEEIHYMKDIITLGGKYATVEKVLASPFYTRIEIPFNPRQHEQWRNNIVTSFNTYYAPPPSQEVSTFILHAVHPIPLYYLNQMSNSQLQFLARYLYDDSYVFGGLIKFGRNGVREGKRESLERLTRTLQLITSVYLQRVDEATGRRSALEIGLEEIMGIREAYDRSLVLVESQAPVQELGRGSTPQPGFSSRPTAFSPPETYLGHRGGGSIPSLSSAGRFRDSSPDGVYVSRIDTTPLPRLPHRSRVLPPPPNPSRRGRNRRLSPIRIVSPTRLIRPMQRSERYILRNNHLRPWRNSSPLNQFANPSSNSDSTSNSSSATAYEVERNPRVRFVTSEELATLGRSARSGRLTDRARSIIRLLLGSISSFNNNRHTGSASQTRSVSRTRITSRARTIPRNRTTSRDRNISRHRNASRTRHASPEISGRCALCNYLFCDNHRTNMRSADTRGRSRIPLLGGPPFRARTPSPGTVAQLWFERTGREPLDSGLTYEMLVDFSRAFRDVEFRPEVPNIRRRAGRPAASPPPPYDDSAGPVNSHNLRTPSIRIRRGGHSSRGHLAAEHVSNPPVLRQDPTEAFPDGYRPASVEDEDVDNGGGGPSSR